MPTIHKEAYEAVVLKLQNELDSILYKVRRNKEDIKTLVRTQTTLKRERVVIQNLLRELRGVTKKTETKKASKEVAVE